VYKLLDDLADLGANTATFTGGEPTTHDALVEFVAYADEVGLKPRVQTNGTTLQRDDLAELEAAGLQQIGTGLDGDPKAHNRLRQSPVAYEYATDMIEQAVDLGISVHVEHTITEYDPANTSDAIAKAHELGVDVFQARAVVPTGRATENFPFPLSPDEYRRFLTLLADANQEYDDIVVGSQDPLYNLVNDEIQQHLAAKYGSVTADEFITGCSALLTFVDIQPNGDVRPCSFIEEPVGNLYDERLRSILGGLEPDASSCDMRCRSQLQGKCGDCDYRYLCGGCRARSHYATGDVYEGDPLCWHEPTESVSQPSD
jgi:radical SAM protein with 4Fe4S-binding SPASM domain